MHFPFKLKKGLIFGLVLICLLSSVSPFKFAQVAALSLDDCEKDSSADVNGCVDLFSAKLGDIANQKKTLSDQITQYDTQIKLTNLRITQAQVTIDQLEKEISTLGFRIGYVTDSIGELEKLVRKRIIATYQQSYVSNFELILTSNSFSDVLLRLQYIRQVQENDKKILSSLQQTKSNYANQKDERETKQAAIEDTQKKLQSLQTSLDRQKTEKQQLLKVTNNDESKYESLLKQAQAQISSFKSFAGSQGGAQILPAQPSPDGWYYNQRDERWGRNNIGSSGEQMWEVGCLVTSTAMVLKKHGQNVTPADIAANSSYFFADTAYMLIPWAGGKISSVWGFNRSAVDAKLSSGELVIVAVQNGGHFVVLKSGSNGNYTMNDPWNGPDLKFSDYYSTSGIIQYGYYNQ